MAPCRGDPIAQPLVCVQAKSVYFTPKLFATNAGLVDFTAVKLTACFYTFVVTY